MLKKTKVALGVVAGIAVAVSAIGYFGGQYYVAQTFKETLSNSGYCMKTTLPVYTVKNSSMAISADCSDFYGYEWKVFSVLKPDWQKHGIYSQTKLIANNEDTINAVSQLIDPKTKALKATGYGLHTFGADHVEVEFEPFQFVSEQNSIVMPTSVLILDKEHASSKIDIVYAPVDDVTIDTLGGETKIKTPRVMWNITDQNTYSISVKSESISVGNVSIANNPIAAVSQSNHDNILDVSVEFKADSITTNQNVDLSLELNNLDPVTSAALFKNSTSLLQETSEKNKSEIITKSLENLFDLAKNNASAKLSLKADEDMPVKTDISIDISFEEDSMNYISKDNAFSILESLIVDAKLKLPTDVAVMMIDPMWLQNFLSDGLIENHKGQLSTEIHFRDMAANVNGKSINL